MLAGICIAIGAIVYCMVGGVAGAILFAIGLLAVVHFKMNLFTGKAGLLATGEIKPLELIQIWLWNAAGTLAVAGLVSLSTGHIAVIERAAAITDIRMQNGSLVNLALGILCGLLMYCAVTGYKETKNIAFVFVPVAVFILSGFNHCVADMFYGWCTPWENIGELLKWLEISLIPTTFGNIIGCNTLPILKKYCPY